VEAGEDHWLKRKKHRRHRERGLFLPRAAVVPVSTYYNEIDPYAADWLRNLMAASLIPEGDVDERSIAEVQPDDVRGYTHCHFFAGIGGWAYAMQLANWPSDRPLWTGSCPCQPFSVAGKRKGTDDHRHLWPEFGRLISECHPATVVGEQVASKDGRQWLAGVFANLEGMAYVVAGADLCAASAGAPHVRQRLWWMADAELSSATRLGDFGWAPKTWAQGVSPVTGSGSYGGLGNPDSTGPQGRGEYLGQHPGQLSPWTTSVDNWVPCLDGKARRLEPGLEPLVAGLPFRLADGRTVETASRKELLRGLGNAIAPQIGAVFLSTVLDLTS
jgi:DNA (cytosine-5)-methyltransferase 1